MVLDSIADLNLENPMDCMNTFPGPVNVVEKQPSPPQQHMPIRPLGAIPISTEFTIATNDLVSTIIVSPASNCRYTNVPPAAKKAMSPSPPWIFCRQHPNPAQQQVLGLQSRSHPIIILIAQFTTEISWGSKKANEYKHCQ